MGAEVRPAPAGLNARLPARRFGREGAARRGRPRFETVLRGVPVRARGAVRQAAAWAAAGAAGAAPARRAAPSPAPGCSARRTWVRIFWGSAPTPRVLEHARGHALALAQQAQQDSAPCQCSCDLRGAGRARRGGAGVQAGARRRQGERRRPAAPATPQPCAACLTASPAQVPRGSPRARASPATAPDALGAGGEGDLHATNPLPRPMIFSTSTRASFRVTPMLLSTLRAMPANGRRRGGAHVSRAQPEGGGTWRRPRAAAAAATPQAAQRAPPHLWTPR